MKTPTELPVFGSGSAKYEAKTVPSGPIDTHGSLARAAEPPEFTVAPGIGMSVQVLPPSVLTPATMPREPPLDQRSCCQTPTKCFGLLGSTAIYGSTWLLRETVPDWPE